QRKKTLKQLQGEHVEQLAAVAKEAGTGLVVAKSKYTVTEAIKKYLTKAMKPESLKRIGPALNHFEKFAGPATPLDHITQARYAEYADQVNATTSWSTATKGIYITAAGTMLRWHARRGEP